MASPLCVPRFSSALMVTFQESASSASMMVRPCLRCVPYHPLCILFAPVTPSLLPSHPLQLLAAFHSPLSCFTLPMVLSAAAQALAIHAPTMAKFMQGFRPKQLRELLSISKLCYRFVTMKDSNHNFCKWPIFRPLASQHCMSILLPHSGGTNAGCGKQDGD